MSGLIDSLIKMLKESNAGFISTKVASTRLLLQMTMVEPRCLMKLGMIM